MLGSGVQRSGVAFEQRADLGLAVAAVAAQRADRGQFAGLGPACDGLRVDAEQRRDLGRGQQWLGLRALTWRRHRRCPPSWGYVTRVLFRVAWPSMHSGPITAYAEPLSVQSVPGRKFPSHR